MKKNSISTAENARKEKLFGQLPSTAQEFLNQTEWAGKKLFEGIQEYLEKLKEIPLTFSMPSPKDTDETTDEAIKNALQKQSEFHGYKFGCGVLCGSILQIAYVGIKQYSKNDKIPTGHFLENKNDNKKVVPFLIGRIVRNVPIGLIIYAGRNQYNHMEEQKLWPINKEIFDKLAYNHGVSAISNYRDPAFDLEEKYIDIFSHNILAILEWKKYSNYLDDMNSLICP